MSDCDFCTFPVELEYLFIFASQNDMFLHMGNGILKYLEILRYNILAVPFVRNQPIVVHHDLNPYCGILAKAAAELVSLKRSSERFDQILAGMLLCSANDKADSERKRFSWLVFAGIALVLM